MVRSEGERLRRVVVSSPLSEYYRAEDPEFHNLEQTADPYLALQQHETLKAILRNFGCKVIDIPELRGHPNSVFTRDTSLATPRGYINLRMGLPTRRSEEKWIAEALNSLWEPCTGSIKAPGTVEGGDVILAGTVAFVGLSLRTNESGAGQLSRLLGDMGYEVRQLILPSTHLHIGGAMSLVGPKTVLCCRGLFPRGFFDGFDTLEIPDRTATSGNAICLGDGVVVAERTNKDAIRALKRAGFTVHTLDLSEFIKGRGGPTCLILPIERR